MKHTYVYIRAAPLIPSQPTTTSAVHDDIDPSVVANSIPVLLLLLSSGDGTSKLHINVYDVYIYLVPLT